jgi:hypothetical protein
MHAILLPSEPDAEHEVSHWAQAAKNRRRAATFGSTVNPALTGWAR